MYIYIQIYDVEIYKYTNTYIQTLSLIFYYQSRKDAEVFLCLCSVNALFSLPSFSIGVDEKLLAEKIENIYQDAMVLYNIAITKYF